MLDRMPAPRDNADLPARLLAAWPAQAWRESLGASRRDGAVRPATLAAPAAAAMM